LPADQVTEDAVKSQEVGQGTGLSFEDLRVDSTGKVAVGIETIEGPVLISASRMDNCSGG